MEDKHYFARKKTYTLCVKKKDGTWEARQILRKARWSLKIRFERLIASLKYRMSASSNRSLRLVAGGTGTRQTPAPLRNRFCPNPFKQIDLEESGAAFTCCSSWLPTPIGNLDHSPVMDIWNGSVIQSIRESIFDGSFRYCRHDRCPVIQNG